MAPSPAQTLELRSYGKGDTKDAGIIAEKSNDKKPPKANIDEVEEFNLKKVDENSLKDLLDEAFSYRNPPDKLGKSKAFQDLLSEVEQGDLDGDLEIQYRNRQVGLRNGYLLNSSHTSCGSSVLNDHSDFEDRRRRKYHKNGDPYNGGGGSSSSSISSSSARKSKFSHSLKINPNNHINSCRPQSYSFKNVSSASRYGKGGPSSSDCKKYSTSYKPIAPVNMNMNMNKNMNMPVTTVSSTNSKVVMSTAVDSSNCASSLYNTHKTVFLSNSHGKTVNETEKQNEDYVLCSVGNKYEENEEVEMTQLENTKEITKRYLSQANLHINGETEKNNDYYYGRSIKESRLAMTSPKPTKDLYIPETPEEPLRKCLLESNKHRRLSKVKSERDNTVTLLNHKKTASAVAAESTLLSCLDQGLFGGPWNYPGVTYFHVTSNNIGDLSSRLSLTKETPEEEKNATDVSREESILENGAIKTMNHCISATQKPYTIIKNSSSAASKTLKRKTQRYEIRCRLSENIDGFCGDKPIDKILDYIEKGIDPELEEKRSRRNKNKIKVVITEEEKIVVEEEKIVVEEEKIVVEEEEDKVNMDADKKEEREEVNNEGIEGDVEEEAAEEEGNKIKECEKTKVKKLKEIKKKDKMLNKTIKKKIKNKAENRNTEHSIINNNKSNDNNNNNNNNKNINSNDSSNNNDKDHSSDTNDFHLVTKKARKKRRRSRIKSMESSSNNNHNHHHNSSSNNKLIINNNKDFPAHDYKEEFKNNNDSDCSQHHRHRRKSTCSMREERDSDSDSIHSLPVSSTTPKLRIKKKSISSGCTPQASYADITKSSSGLSWNRNRKESISSQSSISQNVECEKVKVVEVATQTFRFECDGCGTSIGPIKKAALRPAKSEGDIHPKCIKANISFDYSDEPSGENNKNNTKDNKNKGKKQEKKKTNKTPPLNKAKKIETKGKSDKKTRTLRCTVSDGATSKDEGTPEPLEIRKAISESGKLSSADDLSNPIWHNMQEVVQFVAKGWTEVMKTYPSINKKSGKTIETDSESDNHNSKNQLKHN